jgi:Tol biopolymer transport system component/DNA-binding winged helix-turn-helix (wHTH) protein
VQEGVSSARRRVTFGVFDLDLRSGELRKAGSRINLPDQPFRILAVLLEHPGELVTRDELRSRVWPTDTFVDFDHGLNAAIKRLRDALGDSADTPRFVETLPRRGYRFIAPVDDVVAASASSGNGGGAAAGSGSLAEPQPTVMVGQADGVDTARPRVGSRARPWMLASLAAAAAALVIAVAAGAILRSRQGASTSPGPALSRLTFLDGVQIQPAWSPKGEFIAYASDQSGNLDIWVQPVSGGRAIPVTTDPAADSAPAWAPDGQHIAFRSERDGGGIYLVGAFGGGERRLASVGQRPRWSPDGTRLLCLSETGQQMDWAEKHIYVLTVDGGPPKEVLRSFSKGLVKSPSVAWHPDGERISIWGEHRTLGKGFWTARLPDGEPVLSAGSVDPITQNYWFWWFMDFIWAPSGDALYFTGPGSRSLRNAYRVDVDPGTLRWVAQPVPLTNGRGPDATVAVSPDGHRLAFAGLHEEARLWSFSLGADGRIDQAAGQPLTAPGIAPLLFDFDRAGQKFLLVNGVTGGPQAPPEIRVRDLSTGDERVLSRNVGPWPALPQEPRWSPDGRQIAYVRWKDRDAQGNPQGPVLQEMVLLDAQTGEERVIPDIDGKKVFVVWDFTRDGSAVIVAAGPPDERPWTAVQFPLGQRTASRPRRIPGTPAGKEIWQARISPNGRWLAASAVPKALNSSTLYVGDLLGGEPFVQVTDGTAFDGKPRWSEDGTLLYFTSNRGSPGNVFNVWAIRIDPDRGHSLGAPFQVTTFRNPRLPPHFHDLRIAGGRLFVPLLQTSGSIWMLENIR